MTATNIAENLLTLRKFTISWALKNNAFAKLPDTCWLLILFTL